MSKVRICFLGTPEFAVTSLRKILEDDHFEVVGVVTQPDRPAGRKLQLTPSPVKVLAQAHNLPILTPEKIREEAVLAEIQKWGAEIAVVVAFGQIMPQKFLDMFQFGAVNVHGSILPRWRGAAPIQRGIEAGDKEGGVTLQKMVKELDAGDVIGIRRVKLDQEITAMELHDQLAILGAELLHVELMDYVRGNLAPIPQDPAGVTLAKKIDKAETVISWSDSAEKNHNKTRGFTMGPGTHTSFAGKKIKLHRTKALSESEKKSLKGSPSQAGEVICVEADRLVIACGEGALELLEVQPESRAKMKVSEFLKGHQLKKGDLFGT